MSASQSDSPAEPNSGITIRVNGSEERVDAGITLAEFLDRSERNPKYLAVERNGELVPRTRHAECVLNAGDELEIVTLVGGG